MPLNVVCSEAMTGITIAKVLAFLSVYVCATHTHTHSLKPAFICRQRTKARLLIITIKSDVRERARGKHHVRPDAGRRPKQYLSFRYWTDGAQAPLLRLYLLTVSFYRDCGIIPQSIDRVRYRRAETAALTHTDNQLSHIVSVVYLYDI